MRTKPFSTAFTFLPYVQVVAACGVLVFLHTDFTFAEEPARDKAGMDAEAVEVLVKNHAFGSQPKLNPDTKFDIEERDVAGLEKALKIRLFHVRYLGSEGKQFNEGEFILRNGELTPFAASFGGSGLMSAVVVDDRLFFSYSFGSGIHRSHVSVLSVDGDELRIIDSGGFTDRDLFVRKKGQKVIVEEGKFDRFNSWKSARAVGTVKADADSLAIIDSDGAALSSDFGPHGEQRGAPDKGSKKPQGKK